MVRLTNNLIALQLMGPQNFFNDYLDEVWVFSFRLPEFLFSLFHKRLLIYLNKT